MSSNINIFNTCRTLSPSLFGATVRTALQNLLNINPTSVGKTVVLENDATTGFLSFRLQAAYARPHYRAAYTKAAAEKEWNEIKASLHRRQASLQSPVSGGALPPLFPDYLQVESLVPIYYQSSPQGVPILHYWELRLLPRFTNPLYQKRHSLGSDYHPELGKIGKVPLSEGFREAAQKEIALLGESVTVHFAEGRIIGLDYHHLPVLKENSTEKVDLYPALFQTVAPQTPETDDTESLAAKKQKTTKKANETAQENLSGVLLFKRKGDLLLPFVRLNDGREVAASVEGEGMGESLKQVGEFIKLPIKRRLFIKHDKDIKNGYFRAHTIVKFWLGQPLDKIDIDLQRNDIAVVFSSTYIQIDFMKWTEDKVKADAGLYLLWLLTADERNTFCMNISRYIIGFDRHNPSILLKPEPIKNYPGGRAALNLSTNDRHQLGEPVSDRKTYAYFNSIPQAPYQGEIIVHPWVLGVDLILTIEYEENGERLTKKVRITTNNITDTKGLKDAFVKKEADRQLIVKSVLAYHESYECYLRTAKLNTYDDAHAAADKRHFLFYKYRFPEQKDVIQVDMASAEGWEGKTTPPINTKEQ